MERGRAGIVELLAQAGADLNIVYLNRGDTLLG
jgi:hypothetical protein